MAISVIVISIAIAITATITIIIIWIIIIESAITEKGIKSILHRGISQGHSAGSILCIALQSRATGCFRIGIVELLFPILVIDRFRMEHGQLGIASLECER